MAYLKGISKLVNAPALKVLLALIAKSQANTFSAQARWPRIRSWKDAAFDDEPIVSTYG